MDVPPRALVRKNIISLMPAPKGNKNALKWSRKEALALLERAHAAVGEHCYFLSEVAEACGEYSDVFSYLLKKFKDDEIVFRAIKRLYGKCESLITRKTAEGKITPALGIFILKSAHHLSELSRLRHEGSQERPIRVITDKEGEALVENLLCDNTKEG